MKHSVLHDSGTYQGYIAWMNRDEGNQDCNVSEPVQQIGSIAEVTCWSAVNLQHLQAKQ